MSMIGKTCFIRWPKHPPLEQNVWGVKGSMFIPVRCLSSPAQRDANQTAVVPDIVKCNNATVGYMTIQPDIVACVIVCHCERHWPF